MQWGNFRNWALLRNPKDRGRAHVDERFDPRSGRLVGSYPAAFHINLPKSLAGFGQRHKRGIVMDDVYSLHRLANALRVTDVAVQKFDSLRPARIFPHIEDPDTLTSFEQP